MKNLKNRISSFLKPNKVEVFVHENLLHGHSSLVWDSTKEQRIRKHFQSSTEHLNLLVRNFEKDVESIESVLSLDNLNGIISLSEIAEASCVNALTKLEILVCLNVNKEKFDLNELSNLRILSTHANNIKHLSSTRSLEVLHIEKAKIDFDVSSNLNLHHLSFENGAIENFHCVRNCKGLKKVEARNVNSLQSLEGLNENQEELEYLEIFGASKLKDLESLAALKNLKTLYLQRIPDLPHLRFLKGLSRLERLVMGCEVEEVDHELVKNIKHVFIPNYEGNTMK